MASDTIPSDADIARRVAALDADIARRKKDVYVVATSYVESTRHHLYSPNPAQPSSMPLGGTTVYSYLHFAALSAEYTSLHTSAMLTPRAWPPLLMLAAGNPHYPEAVRTFPGPNQWRQVLDDVLALTIEGQSRALRACVWFFDQCAMAEGTKTFDAAAAAPDKHPKEQAIYAREQIWQMLDGLRLSDQAARKAEFSKHEDYPLPFESEFWYQKEQARNELAAAVAKRHDALMGSWFPKTKFIAGSCSTQETALRSLSRAFQSGNVQIAKAADKAALDTVVSNRKRAIASITATGSPVWQDAAGVAYAPVHGVLAHHFEWTSAAQNAARQLILSVIAASPDASDDCAIMSVGNANAEIETALTVPSGHAKRHRLDVYWTANADLAAGKTYAVHIHAQNECGDAHLQLDIASPQPATAD